MKKKKGIIPHHDRDKHGQFLFLFFFGFKLLLRKDAQRERLSNNPCTTRCGNTKTMSESHYPKKKNKIGMPRESRVVTTKKIKKK